MCTIATATFPCTFPARLVLRVGRGETDLLNVPTKLDTGPVYRRAGHEITFFRWCKVTSKIVTRHIKSNLVFFRFFKMIFGSAVARFINRCIFRQYSIFEGDHLCKIFWMSLFGMPVYHFIIPVSFGSSCDFFDCETMFPEEIWPSPLVAPSLERIGNLAPTGIWLHVSWRDRKTWGGKKLIGWLNMLHDSQGRHFVFFWGCSCTLNVKFCIPSADFAPSIFKKKTS